MKIKVRILAGFFAVLLVFGLLGTANATTFTDLMSNGGNRLVNLQNDDGGWDWPLDDGNSASASPKNTAAPIAMGLLAAYESTGNGTYLTQAIEAGEFIITNSPPHSTGNALFMNKLSEITGDSKYADDVRTKYYNALEAGTYDKDGIQYGTASYAQYLLDYRGSKSQYNLGIWDVGLAAAGAAAIGANQVQLDIWADKLEVGLNNWDGTYADGGSSFSVIGLAGGLFGLSELGQNLDSVISSGNHLDGAQTTFDLANILIGYQAPLGGFGKYADYPLDLYTGVQETAYAILALESVDAILYADEINSAASWLMDIQLATGGWGGSFAGASGENNEVTGEALWAINAAVPEPATMFLFGLGLLGVAGVSRRKK